MKRTLGVVIFALAAFSASAELPFIENDYGKAVAQAKARNLPIFVEGWATWCQTCRSMEAYVFVDKALNRYANRFVWLKINIEAAEAAPFLKRYPIPVLPTFLIIDPYRDSVVARHVGGANVAQVKKFLEDGEQVVRQRSEAAADRLLMEADSQAAEGKFAEAAQSFEQTLKHAPSRWSRYARAAEGLISALAMAMQPEKCASRALEVYPKVKGTQSAVPIVVTGFSCAVHLDEKNAKRAELLDKLEKATQQVFDDPKLVLTGDDRSYLYATLGHAKQLAGDVEGEIELQLEWAAFLEGAAARAKTPEQRAVYDVNRLTVYLFLGLHEKAIEMLEQSERDFPSDYTAPSRLAIVYRAMQDWDKALAASNRAMATAYGPRKLSLYSVRVDILLGKGDVEGARATLTEAIAYGKSLPDVQRNDHRVAAFEKRLAKLSENGP